MAALVETTGAPQSLSVPTRHRPFDKLGGRVFDPDPGEHHLIGSSFSIMGTMIESPAQPEFDELTTSLVGEGAVRSQMMGRPMLSLGGKMFACLDGPVLAVKLGRNSPEFHEALDLPGASVFSPGQGSRSFRDWVALPLDAVEDWERYARAGMASVGSGHAKR